MTPRPSRHIPAGRRSGPPRQRRRSTQAGGGLVVVVTSLSLVATSLLGAPAASAQFTQFLVPGSSFGFTSSAPGATPLIDPTGDEYRRLLAEATTAARTGEVDLAWFLYFHHMFQELAVGFGFPGIPDLFDHADVVAQYEELTGTTVRELDFYYVYAGLRTAIILSRITRRRVHFGEVEAPATPNEYVLHHTMLERLISA